jgi:25S rRNA (uracil2634-N3)-methyltransferase
MRHGPWPNKERNTGHGDCNSSGSSALWGPLNRVVQEKVLNALRRLDSDSPCIVHYQSTTLPTRVHGVRGSLTTSPAVGHDSAPAANGGGSREGAGPAEEGVLGMRVVEGAPEADEEEEKWLGQYSSTQSILLVGDGDFSFSLALATGFGSGANLVATSLDTYGSSAFALSCLVNVAPLLLGISGNG